MSQATRTVFCALAISMAVANAGQAQTSGTRTSSFAYDPASGLLTQEVIEPNQSALRLQTDYVYDAFGNKTQATVSGVDIVTRSASTTYDAQGQFVVSATNALNQSESRQFDARFGQPTSQTGPNNLTTTWSYDSFGRKTLEVRPDGTQTKWEYLFCSGVNGGTESCPAGGAYLMRATPLASDGVTQNGPIGTVYFDRLDREIAKDIQGFDGSLTRISTEYDSFGRLLRKSRPYFVSGGTPQWTVPTYDALGRVITETRPDSSTVQTAYHGLVTTETNPLSQTRTTTRNSQGQVVSVTDALNQTTTYVYDPFGNLTSTTDPLGNVVTATYDARGRKIASNDPNMGVWTYSYNTLDQLVSQIDAKIQSTTIVYDKLGRVTQRNEPDMTAVWTYDTAPNGIGKLASASITAGADAGFQRALSYDGLSRPVQVATTIDSQTYNVGVTYDAHGRQSTASYPSGFSVSYAYNSLGYVQQLKNTASGQTYWTANARDAELHLIQQSAGNGVVTNRGFNAQTGRLTAITAGLGSGSAVESMSYSYDTLGNLLTRADANTGLSESFSYDPLNRLTSSTVGASATKLFGYDAVGNLLNKSDVGNYTYPAPGQPRPHAVISIAGSMVNTTFTYDSNGNQTAGLNRTIGYTSYNKPNSITQGTRTITFSHDMDHQRFKQVAPEASTLYIGGFGIFAELYTTSSGTRWNEYLVVGKTTIGVRFLFADETTNTRYFHQDHLGSIAVITNEAGAVIERNSHDSWGKRRFPDGTDDPTGSVTSITTQGYTGQEELTGFGLVHLNGRVYDPFVGRMMSADPTVPEPTNAQAWNRYSYVINNPLAFTDPTGYSWLSEAYHAVQNLLRSVPILGAIIKIAAVALCNGVFICAVVAAVISSAAVAGITTGRLDAALKAGIIAGATALAFNEVGNITAEIAGESGIQSAYAFNVAAHAAVGCASSVASGGKCGPGALSAGITAAASPFISDKNDFVGSLVRNTVLGGVASVAAGGKFANGAITGAFGYLFNQLGHDGEDPYRRHQLGVNATALAYQAEGYEIIGREVPVFIAGFLTPRVYDLLILDPATQQTFGVEVKTTLVGTIFLNPDQVEKDTALAKGATAFYGAGLAVDGVEYRAFCFSPCYGGVEFRSTTLSLSLMAAGVPVGVGQLRRPLQ